MDARSITATAINGGWLTAATELDYPVIPVAYTFNRQIYDNRVYNGYGKPEQASSLKFGPNIVDWPKMTPLPENLLLKVVVVITDPVTTTNELIPSGETSSLSFQSFETGRVYPLPESAGICRPGQSNASVGTGTATFIGGRDR